MSENKNKINPPDLKRVKVLFLCTGNSCRSQIAEGWAKHLKGDIMDVYSAGIAPRTLNQMAVKVMAEAGVDISAQRPKHIDELGSINFDYVVTVCDNARENCPIFPHKTKLFHKTFEDPTFMAGTEQQIKAAFVKLRDQMKKFIEKMPKILEKESIGQK
jgi:arsenate reductase